ncbi:class I SAM-dependent methyltransferase [Streptomyces cinnabarinus]|uniref:Class I SAM-dependent methyltransferase n=1 Tax=Streptomyces cinnabarinus TaxID=67287 RepID=A0ABY7KA66_9ACTN|nr:class I SAM-dependent methyltransferase [Streptomyces cinnabarinus]WAZ19631.1 class I SAM-dependent methyltransferase [Streptomyces cinnabarinus]
MTQDIATVRRHRWHAADSYDEATGRLQRRNAALVAGLHPDPGAVRNALDVGCGTGALTEELLTRLPTAAHITGLDVSADMLHHARARTGEQAAGRLEFRHGSLLDPEAVTGAFDAVFSNAALHWMYPRYDDCFARLRHLLAPDGLLCAATAGRSAATDDFDRRVGARVRRLLGQDTADDFTRRRLSCDELTVVAGRNALAVEDVFLVERRAAVSVPAYVTWWLASGGPWQEDPPRRERAVELLQGALGGPDGEIELVHASVFTVLRRPVGRD